MQIRTEKILTKNAVVYLLAVLCCLLWGSAFPCIKMGYSLLGITTDNTASQILFAGVRFALTGVLTIILFGAVQKRVLVPQKKSWFQIAKLGIVQTIVQYIFFYIGLSNTDSAKSSIIGGIGPFVSILFACFLYRQEKFTRAKFIGSLLGFAGIVLINLDFVHIKMDMSFAGEGFLIISNVASAMSASMTKNYAKAESPIVLCGYQFILGGAVLTVVGLFMGGTLNFTNIGAVLILAYLALLSAVSYTLWSILLKYNPVSKVTIFGFAIPLFGVVLSAVLLRETRQAFNLQSLAALLLVCTGIIIINKIRPARMAKS